MIIPDVFTRVPEARPVRGVLHVGAHTCEESPIYASLGLSHADVVWIDANSDLKPSGMDNYWIAAVSDKDGEDATFHITNNKQSSSLMNLKFHLIAHPEVHEVAQRSVKTWTLNTLLKQKGVPYDRFDVMNLDIQGSELNALRGATLLLPHLKAIYMEVNVKELYEGGALVSDVDDFLATYGFTRTETSMAGWWGWGDALYVKSK